MKKLVYLLILSLCLNGMAGATFPWMSAFANTKTEAGAEKKASKKADKAETDKKQEEKKSKKTKVEKEYPLDLDGNNQVTLSQIIEYAKLKIRLKDVKSIELDDKKSKKLIVWEPDEENEGDYIFTVLKNFKEVRLHVNTRKVSRLVVLLNGDKDGRAQPEAGEGSAPEDPTTEAEPEPQAGTGEESAPTDPMTEAESDPQAPSEEPPASEPVGGGEMSAAPEGEPAAEIAVASLESIEAPEAATGEEQTGVETEVIVEAAQETPDGDPPAEPTIPETGDAGLEAAPGDQGEPAQREGDGTEEGSVATEAPVDAPEVQAETPEAGETRPEDPQPAPEGGTDAAEETMEQAHDTPRRETGAVIPVDAEAWFKRGADLYWGTLKELVGALNGGETVYIQTDRLIFLEDAPLQLLATVTLLPDGDVFKGGYAVCISRENPAIVDQPALVQPAELASMGELADLYFWVGRNNTGEAGKDEDQPTLVVKAKGLEETGWSRQQPVFTLSGIPKGKEWSYAAIIYDERIVPIAVDTYVPEAEGVYSLRFAMLDELGDIRSASNRYALQLDWTPPEVSIEEDEEVSFTLNIDATDNFSGVDKLSIDGGKTWLEMDDGSYTITEKRETTFKAGSICVSDVAGNIYRSEEDYVAAAVEEEEEEGGGGGGGGGNGSDKPKLPHSSGDGDEGAEYDALELELPDEPMAQLTVGGEPMALTLLLASAQEPSPFVGANRPFTARLAHWDDASDSDAANTLVLEAEVDDGLGDAFTYEWRFNGEVYRMLANSGIRYVALKAGDAVAAFPTEGFTGGTRYTELKMQGVSTRRFDYTLAMRLNLDPSHVSAMTEYDFSQDCDLSIHVDVEGKNYELSHSPQSMMYFYNVFVGPGDMLDQPFGEYDAAA